MSGPVLYVDPAALRFPSGRFMVSAGPGRVMITITETDKEPCGLFFESRGAIAHLVELLHQAEAEAFGPDVEGSR